MSIKYLSAHTVQDGDTIESLVSQYRLSSWQAIAESPANNALRSMLSDQRDLPIGLVINIPPGAADLSRERIYGLNRLKPECLKHFDQLQESADTDLQQAVLVAESLADSHEVRQVLFALRADVEAAIRELAERALPLVLICKGMAYTHVAQPADHAVSERATDPRNGLYWALSPDALALWGGMWEEDLWMAKWQDLDMRSAWEATSRHLHLVRSVVVQQIDQRLRETLSLQRQLRAEFGN
jgi:hypothetical protein